MTDQPHVATFGAGCFWGIETAFSRLPGITETSVGFMGGRLENPTYDAVCIGNTGHAEVVRAHYEPDAISYNKLLELFWVIHDPTTWVRSNPDIASQYRSAIFYHTPEQHLLAEQSKSAAQPRHRNAIATEITPAGVYYLADDYHQKFEKKQGWA